jgi:hypothetical protein
MRRTIHLAALIVASTGCNPSTKVDPADTTCSADDERVMAMTHCSCDCGAPINRAHWAKYMEAQERMCKDYVGPMCKMKCPDAVCESGVCRIKK